MDELEQGTFKVMANPVELAVFCALSACGVSSEHLNYKKHSMVMLIYRFQVYYLVRRVLKRLQVPLPHKAGFNPSDNPHSNEEFFKLCEDYKIPHDSMRYQNEKFFGTQQHGVGRIT